MPNEVPRPLHRLTPLGDDPAAAWLSAAGRLRVGLTGVLGWGMFIVGIFAAYFVLQTVIFGFFFPHIPDVFGMQRKLVIAPLILTVMLVLAILPLARRAILRRKSARIAATVRRCAPVEALTVDDWTELATAPEDQPLSVVGWARARQRFPHPVAGEPCIGLALPCQQAYPGIMETLYDFDLVDESGQALPIQVAGGRMLGEPTINLGGGGDDHVILIASLDLPAGAAPAGWHAFVVRDGDPLLIVGFKKSVVDPAEHGLRQSPVRAGVASSSSHPLLIFPIDAERRTATPWG